MMVVVDSDEVERRIFGPERTNKERRKLCFESIKLLFLGLYYLIGTSLLLRATN
jgi:hypothetical protein